jgi:hypothetical protein
MVHPIGIPMDLVSGESLVAGKTTGDGISLVRPQPNELAVFDLGQQTAGRLADPTER